MFGFVALLINSPAACTTGISTSGWAAATETFVLIKDKHPNLLPMKTTRILSIAVLALALGGSAQRTLAQNQPANTYVVQTTVQFVLPEGTTRADVQKAFQEYYDKVVSKSTLIKHFAIYIHAWGSHGASFVRSMEFGKWEDIGKFEDELEALEKAAWPDETARKAFLNKLDGYSSPYHSDEIYSVMNSMRK